MVQLEGELGFCGVFGDDVDAAAIRVCVDAASLSAEDLGETGVRTAHDNVTAVLHMGAQADKVSVQSYVPCLPAIEVFI